MLYPNPLGSQLGSQYRDAKLLTAKWQALPNKLETILSQINPFFADTPLNRILPSLPLTRPARIS
ncbi:MAG: hypothetical protein DWH78_13365 [Planctomycetota bacterium]|nr:MAG: hypothetical protein DWH78_13365 [Planctomycetota bacterium]